MPKIYLTLVLTLGLSLAQPQRRRYSVTQLEEGVARSSDPYSLQEGARFDPRSQYPTSPRTVEINQYPTSQRTIDYNQYNGNQRNVHRNQYRGRQRSSQNNQILSNQRKSESNYYHANQKAVNEPQYTTQNDQYLNDQRTVDNNQYLNERPVDNQYQNQRYIEHNQYPTDQRNEEHNQYYSNNNQYPTSPKPEQVSYYYSTTPSTVEVSQYPTHSKTVEVSNHYPTSPRAVDGDINRNKYRRKPKQTYYPKVVSFYQKPTTNNGYEFKYVTADGVQRAERGYMSDKGVWTVEGSVTSLDDENTALVQSYIADGSGYKSSVRKHTAGSFRSLDDFLPWATVDPVDDNGIENRMDPRTIASLVGGG